MKRATVVGGSLTGLAAGILLRRIGWEVNIFERSSQVLSDRGAGIVMQQETLEMLGLCGAKSDGDVGVRLSTRQYLAADGTVISSQPMPQLMTSWGLLYSWFKKSFPEQNYHLGHEFQNLEQSESSVTSYFKGGTHDSADLLIGADGFRSGVRALLLRRFSPSMQAMLPGAELFLKLTFRKTF